MENNTREKKIKNIGFIATRLAGTDGVSLEVAKWDKIFEKNDCRCFYMAGELDRPNQRSLMVEEAHFEHPEIQKICRESFSATNRKLSTSKKIHQIKDKLKK